MAERISGETLSEKRVSRAVDYVSDYWFPVNPALLEAIQDKIAGGHYAPSQPREVVDDIRSDFSLFTFCLRKLHQMLRNEGLSVPPTLSPLQMLEWAGTERLIDILEDGESELGSHNLGSAGSLQTKRLEEMLVSSTTAETLSEHYGIDSETAYSAAVLRQLGVTLISWNYPGLYEEVVRTLTGGDSLEEKLAERLGYSPNMLAIRVMNSWGMSSAQCEQLGLVADPEEAIQEAMGDTLIELCEVGEALARAQQPEIYPSAREDWSFARKAVEEALGPDGMQIIQEKIMEHAEVYLGFMPDVFDFGLVLEQDEFMSDEARIEEQFGNPFLDQCAPQLARQMFQLYQNIADGHTRRDNVREYINEVVPSGQFTGGCVYTADPSLMLLIPQIDFGNIRLRQLHGVDYSVTLSNADMISVSYQSVDPVVEYRMAPDGEVVTGIAGMFGKSQKVGVLYLEIPDAVNDFMEDSKVLHFKALRHLLNEVLRLT